MSAAHNIAMSVSIPVQDGGFGFTPWETESGPAGSDERRIRRMISNRESARRSRMRKQRHLEELRSSMNRLRSENRELSGRLGAVAHYCALFQSDNDRLRSESAALRRRLSEIRRLLMFRQIQRLSSPPPPPYGFASPGSLAAVCGGFELNNSSLIA